MGNQFALTEILEAVLGNNLSETRQNVSIPCPFHKERHPSFSINLDTGLWVCFACGARGNYESLCNRLGVEPNADYKVLRAVRDAGVRPKGQRDFSGIANRCVADLNRHEGRDASLHYLAIKPTIRRLFVDTFNVGYSKERRALSFPYPDLEGRIRGIKYRHYDGSKSSEDGSDFGIYFPGLAFGKSIVIICEGESDVHSVWSMVPSEVGVCGTSGSPVSPAFWEHAANYFIFTRNIYLLQDADAAGDESAQAAMSVLGDKCKRLRPTRGKDITGHYIAGGTLEELGYER